MKTSNPLPIKRFGKHDRERKVLLGLVDYYIKTGKPVGSNTLKETEFAELSSATIRNYFSHLEEDGYLTQAHSSGGRIPTNAAFRLYAASFVEQSDKEADTADIFKKIRENESKEITTLLQEGAEILGQHTNCAVFLSAPRFDHDFVSDLKLVTLEGQRCLCIIITDFGVIQTEVMQLPAKLSSFSTKRIESYFTWRLKGGNKPELTHEEEALAQTFYNELMVRYIVGYSNFIDEEIYRTCFSRLLRYPEFQEANALAASLALFENAHAMRLLVRECIKLNQIKYWIGEDLSPYTAGSPTCTVVSIPYYINRAPAGAVGILGPTRLPYRQLFSILRHFSENVSEALTRNVYKYKISFRQPQAGQLYLEQEEHHTIGQSRLILLEDKRK